MNECNEFNECNENECNENKNVFSLVATTSLESLEAQNEVVEFEIKKYKKE